MQLVITISFSPSPSLSLSSFLTFSFSGFPPHFPAAIQFESNQWMRAQGPVGSNISGLTSYSVPFCFLTSCREAIIRDPVSKYRRHRSAPQVLWTHFSHSNANRSAECSVTSSVTVWVMTVTVRSGVILEKLTVTQLVKKFSVLFDPVSSLHPAPIAAQSKASTVFDRSNIGIAGSNPAQGMDVCPRFSVLCCPV
jgi:hypothetical protein